MDPEARAALGRLEGGMERVHARLDQHDARLDRHDARFDRLDESVQELHTLIVSQSDETRRHFDVVAETLRSELRALAEAHSGERVQRLEGQRAQDARIATLGGDLGAAVRATSARVDSLELRTSALESRAGASGGRGGGGGPDAPTGGDGER